MGLKITSSEEHSSGNVTTTYVHISEYYKSKDNDKVQVATRWYTAKARRDSDINNTSTPKSISNTTILLDMTMVAFQAISNTTDDVYALLKTYFEGQGKTVADA